MQGGLRQLPHQEFPSQSDISRSDLYLLKKNLFISGVILSGGSGQF